MKKLFLMLTLILIVILMSIYGVLFTKYGNELLSSYIEAKVSDEQKDVRLKVNNFTFTFNSINFDASINDNSNINISGDLSLFKKSIDLKYDIKINDLSVLKNLTNQDFKGRFFTNGIFKGDIKEAIIQGFSNLANSQTKYYINLVDFEIKNINVEIQNAKIDELLAFVNQPMYTKGTLNINANINKLDIDNFDGIFKLNIFKAQINNEVLNKEFNQKIQSLINFESDMEVSFLGDKIELKSKIISSIADIFIEKTLIDLKKKSLLSDYKIEVKNLNKLEGILGKKLNGEFLTTGNISYENLVVLIDGISNIFESTTSYNLKIEDSFAQNINFKIENGKIEKLMHMLNQPIYATGNLDVNGEIKTTDLEKLDGSIVSKVSNAKVINEVVNAVFKQNLKDTINFDLGVNTSLIPNQAVSKIVLSTNIANLNSEKAIFDFKENIFNSDYLLNIPSLVELKDFTKTKLRGKMDIKGQLSNKENLLLVSGKSDILGGVLDFELKNDDLNAKLNNVGIKELSYMMFNPEIFDSKGSFNLDYNSLTKKGEITGSLLNGHFLENDFSILVNQLAKFDLTKEIYETVDIKSQINQNQLVSTLSMKSQNTQIDIKDSLLDFEQNTIDAKVDTKVKKSNFSVFLNGDISKPKISLDTKEILKNELDKKLEKIDDKKTKELIKNLKSIF